MLNFVIMFYTFYHILRQTDVETLKSFYFAWLGSKIKINTSEHADCLDWVGLTDVSIIKLLAMSFQFTH